MRASMVAGDKDRVRAPARFAGGAGRALPWPAVLLVLAVAAFAFALPFALNAKASDLDVFFWPAAELAAHGHPLLVYTLRAGPYTNANGPLALAPLTVVALVANALGWASDAQLRDALTLALFSPFTLLLARETARLVEMSGWVSRRPAVYAATCLSLPLWIAIGSFGHVEIPVELWLTVVALRQVLRGRPAAAGALLGLSLLTRTTSVVALCCLALMALATIPAPASDGDPVQEPVAATGRAPSFARRILGSLTLLAVAAATTLAGILPFLLADSHDVVVSLLTFRAALPISGGSLWVLLARGLPWAGAVQQGDALIFTAAAVLLVGAALWRTRREPLTPARASGLLCVAACCAPLLAKTTWAYYLADPYAFAVIWILARPGRLRRRAWAVPLLVALVSVLLAVAGVTEPPTAAQVVAGVAAGVLLAVALVVVLRSVTRPRSEAQPAA